MKMDPEMESVIDDSDKAHRFVTRYLEHEMPDADAETIERAARDFLAALQD